MTVPLMLAAGFVAAVMLTYIPLESITIFGADSYTVVMFAALLEVLLPTPMFVDIILVMGLIELGLEKGPAAALLVTLAPISIFSASIIWRHVSPKLAISLLGITATLGMIGGGIVSSLASIEQQLYARGYIDKAVFEENADQAGIVGIVSPWPSATAEAQPAAQMFGSDAAWADYNNDKLLDLFVPSEQGNRLYKNNGDGTFSDITLEAGLNFKGYSVSGIWADYDNDLDLYVANGFFFAIKPERETLTDRIGIGVFNLNRFYENDSTGSYSDVTKQVGLWDAHISRGVAFSDYNNDKFTDIYVVNKHSKNKLYINKGNNNKWIKIRLHSTRSNRDAIGARVTVSYRNGSQTKMVHACSSFLSSHSPWLNFGLADSSLIKKIIVQWPSGHQQQLADVPANQNLRIEESI